MLSARVSYVVYSETRGQPSGVDVILVEARAATTSFLREIAVRAQELLAGGPPELLQRHGPVLRGYTRRTHEQTGTDTNVMARAIGEALTAPRPALATSSIRRMGTGLVGKTCFASKIDRLSARRDRPP